MSSGDAKRFREEIPKSAKQNAESRQGGKRAGTR